MLAGFLCLSFGFLFVLAVPVPDNNLSIIPLPTNDLLSPDYFKSFLKNLPTEFSTNLSALNVTNLTNLTNLGNLNTFVQSFVNQSLNTLNTGALIPELGTPQTNGNNDQNMIQKSVNVVGEASEHPLLNHVLHFFDKNLPNNTNQDGVKSPYGYNKFLDGSIFHNILDKTDDFGFKNLISEATVGKTEPETAVDGFLERIGLTVPSE